MERPKLKTNGSLLENGLDFESVDPAEGGPGPQSAGGARRLFCQPYRKGSCFDEETKKISRALADLR